MVKKILYFFIFSVFFLLPQKTLSFSQFDTKYNIEYEVLDTGTTEVTYKIDQTNNLTKIYATNFNLSVNQSDLSDIKAEDGLGKILPKIEKAGNLTNISIKFKNKVVGKNKTNSFKISYKTNEIATKIGSIWEINIPRLLPDENTTSVTINLKTPPQLGAPAYINPQPSQIINNTYQFQASQLANQPISAVFGTKQYFRFKLKYYLENQKSYADTYELALPPDTNYQKIYYSKLTPKPDSIETDIDGNWIAKFKLDAKKQLNFTASGFVEISLSPKKTPPPQTNPPNQTIWPIDNPQILQIAKNLTDPESIYNFVVGSLNYNYQRLKQPPQRQGALFALNNPDQAICTEFADLFVTLARSKGVSARELEGFSFSSNPQLKPLGIYQDILHAWPEYYSKQKQTWIQIDPTWANTTKGIDYFNKLDLNHFVFVIHGQNPTQPPPAGAYRKPNSTEKNIFIEPISPQKIPTVKLNSSISKKGSKINLQIHNISGVGISGPLNLTSNGQIVYNSYIKLAAYENKTLDIPIKTNNSEKIILTINGTRYKTTHKNLKNPIKVYTTTGIILLFTAFFIRGVYLRKKRQHTPIRW